MSDRDIKERTTQPWGRWPGGMDNVHDLRELPTMANGQRAAVRRGLNVDFQKSGRPVRRRGRTLVAAGNFHSFWAHGDWAYALVVKDDVLQRLTLVDGVEVLTPVTTVAPSRLWSWDHAGDWVFGSNGLQRMKLDSAGVPSAWGVEDPGGQPLLAVASTGGLDAGSYQVGITFLSATGEESGSAPSASISVEAGQGITLSAIPQPVGSDVATIRVYVTPPDGEALYAARDVPVGTATLTIIRGDLDTAGRMLETALCTRMPPGKIVRAYKGRIYVAVGKILYYSLALRYGLIKQHYNSIRFPYEIQAVVPVGDGIYVGTDRETVFLPGDDPTKMKRDPLQPFGIVYRSDCFVPGEAFGPEAPQELLGVWWNTNGNLVRGDPGGKLTHLTQGQLALPKYASGATMRREIAGMQQIVSALRGPGEVSAFAARDTIVAEVVRNGVVV